MLLIFTCEHCGKRFQVDEHAQGRRGRCSHCGQVMRIPGVKTDKPAHAPAAGDPPAAPEPEPQFRLSPPEPRPLTSDQKPPRADEPPAQHATRVHDSVFAIEPQAARGHEPKPHGDHVRFDLLDDEDDPALVAHVSPAVKRGLEEIADFEKDRRGYKIVGERSGPLARFGLGEAGPAGWLYTKWRAGVSVVLRLLRWIDTWAYLLSVPFLMLMIFGIAVANRRFLHIGAAVVVLANYGRFWADLIALFVRPYKDGPLQGLAFLFPPYTLYYLATRWDQMKRILRRIATSCIPILLVIVIYGFLPSVNPAANQAQGFGAKLQAGKDELDRQIGRDLKTLEKKLIGDSQPPAAAPGEPPP